MNRSIRKPIKRRLMPEIGEFISPSRTRKRNVTVESNGSQSFSNRMSSNLVVVSADSPHRVNRSSITDLVVASSSSQSQADRSTTANLVVAPSSSQSQVERSTIANLVVASSSSQSQVERSTANLVVAPTDSQSQVKRLSLSPSTNLNRRINCSPIRKSQGLRGRLDSARRIQSRRSQTRMKIKVEPKKVKFISGINRFSDGNYDYMLRINDGELNLAELSAPVKLHIYAFDISPIASFQRLVLVGEASFHTEPVTQLTPSRHSSSLRVTI